MRKICSIAAVLVLAAIATSGNAQTLMERGRTLYELRCGECHTDSLHKRSVPAARNCDDIRSWVMHWSGVLSAGWEREDIDAVTHYLNQRFYRYACPTDPT
jgi:mono/diheme cytochrome c family protein